jgi:hypothetical protein
LQNGEICCLLKHFDLDDVHSNGISDENDRQWSFTDVFGTRSGDLGSPFTYQALSYHWGDGERLNIIINGKLFKVRENLYRFLDECRRTPLVYNYIWIDQICIDQGTIQERNHQVQLMGSIFESASQVVAWLGPVNGDISEVALRFIKEETQSGSRSGDSPEQSILVKDSGLLIESLGALFARPYWTRLWIVQEVLLAKDLVFCLGHVCAPTANLILFCHAQIKWLREISNDGLNISTRTFLVPKEVCELIYGAEYRAPTNTPNTTSSPPTPKSKHKGSRERMRALKHFSLSQLIANFSGLACVDPRDKVFGLLGLVRRKDRITIDYRMSCAKILGVIRDHVHSVERLQVLGLRMGIAIHVVNEILHLPGQDNELALALGRAPSKTPMDKFFPSGSYSALKTTYTREPFSPTYRCCGEIMESVHLLLQHMEMKHRNVAVSRSITSGGYSFLDRENSIL